jgi:hypothetical protein
MELNPEARYHAAMTDTLALDITLWDLDTDSRGNLRTVGDATPQSDQTSPGMRLAQDVATRVQAWQGEVYFDTTQGINYPAYFGGPPNLSLLQSVFNTEALKVPLCATALAQFTFTAGSKRVIGGVLNVSDIAGNGGQVAL